MTDILRYLPAFFSRDPESVAASITAPIEQGLDDVRAAVPEAVDQIALVSADQNWLDRHGRLYGLPPLPVGSAQRAAAVAAVGAELVLPASRQIAIRQPPMRIVDATDQRSPARFNQSRLSDRDPMGRCVSRCLPRQAAAPFDPRVMRYFNDDCRRQWWVAAYGTGSAGAILDQIGALWVTGKWSVARLSDRSHFQCGPIRTAANPRVSAIASPHWPAERLPNDAKYRAHLIAEITRPRGTPKAIEANVRRRLGFEITVTETWKWTTRWSVSPLSAGHHLPDYAVWGRNLLRIDYPDEADASDRLLIRAVAEDDRAAGCIIIDDCGCAPLTWMDGGWDTRTWDYCTNAVVTPVSQAV